MQLLIRASRVWLCQTRCVIAFQGERANRCEWAGSPCHCLKGERYTCYTTSRDPSPPQTVECSMLGKQSETGAPTQQWGDWVKKCRLSTGLIVKYSAITSITLRTPRAQRAFVCLLLSEWIFNHHSASGFVSSPYPHIPVSLLPSGFPWSDFFPWRGGNNASLFMRPDNFHFHTQHYLIVSLQPFLLCRFSSPDKSSLFPYPPRFCY